MFERYTVLYNLAQSSTALKIDDVYQADDGDLVTYYLDGLLLKY